MCVKLYANFLVHVITGFDWNLIRIKQVLFIILIKQLLT